MAQVQRILQSNVLHEFLFLCLNGVCYEKIHLKHVLSLFLLRCVFQYLKEKAITENTLYFTIYLLELAVLHVSQ